MKGKRTTIVVITTTDVNGIPISDARPVTLVVPTTPKGNITKKGWEKIMKEMEVSKA